MDQRFLENHPAAGQVSEFEVAGRVFGDLLPKPGLVLEEVVIDSGADDGERVVHVCEGEEGFTLKVGFGDGEAVEERGVVVEDSEEVVVVIQELRLG